MEGKHDHPFRVFVANTWNHQGRHVPQKCSMEPCWKGLISQGYKESLTRPVTHHLHGHSSPKTKMINGIMLVVFPYPFVQVSLWRCNLETTDWIVVPGAWVPNPPNADSCMPVAFWGLAFGKVKALLHKPMHQHLLVGDPLVGGTP